MEIVFYYIIAINLLSSIICIYDKISARRNGWRVSESVLFLLSFVGGSVTMYLTMRIIHHKTRHNKFMLGIPLMIVLQIIFLIAISSFF